MKDQRLKVKSRKGCIINKFNIASIVSRPAPMGQTIRFHRLFIPHKKTSATILYATAIILLNNQVS